MSGHNWQPDADWIQKHEPGLDFQKCSECAMVRCWAGDGRFRCRRWTDYAIRWLCFAVALERTPMVWWWEL